MKFKFELLQVERQIIDCTRVDRPIVLVCAFVAKLKDWFDVFREIGVPFFKPEQSLNVSVWFLGAKQDWENLVLRGVDLEIVDLKIHQSDIFLIAYPHNSLARCLFKVDCVHTNVAKLRWGEVDY